MSEHRLICRKGFGFVLVVLDTSTSPHKHKGDFFVFKSPVWDQMKQKIALAESLFGVKCEYENFTKEELPAQQPTSPLFNRPFFRKAPAMASLETIMEPKPDHVRACLLEMTRYMLRSGVNAPDPEEV